MRSEVRDAEQAWGFRLSDTAFGAAANLLQGSWDLLRYLVYGDVATLGAARLSLETPPPENRERACRQRQVSIVENSRNLRVGHVGLVVPVIAGVDDFFELAENVLKLTGSGSKLVHRPLPADDPKQRQPNIALALEKLGWKPEVPLVEGLKPTIAYFANLKQH